MRRFMLFSDLAPRSFISGAQIVVGVNKYQPANDAKPNVLKVDNAAVRAAQLDKLKRLRAERDEQKTQAALNALT